MRPPLGWEGQNIVDPRFRGGDNQPVSRRAVLHRRHSRPALYHTVQGPALMPAPLSFPRKREPRG